MLVNLECDQLRLIYRACTAYRLQLLQLSNNPGYADTEQRKEALAEYHQVKNVTDRLFSVLAKAGELEVAGGKPITHETDS